MILVLLLSMWAAALALVLPGPASLLALPAVLVAVWTWRHLEDLQRVLEVRSRPTTNTTTEENT